MTMTATYGSSSSFLGGPGAAYDIGLGWVLLAMSQVVTGYFVLLVLGKKFAIVTRKMNSVTLIDFLKERYQSTTVVLLSAISVVVFLFSAMAAQWIGGAHLIESLTDLSYTGALFIFAVADSDLRDHWWLPRCSGDGCDARHHYVHGTLILLVARCDCWRWRPEHIQ